MQISAQSPLLYLQSLNQNHRHHHLCFIFSSHIHADPLKPTPRTSLHFSIETDKKTLKTARPFKTLQCRVRTFESENSSQSGSFEKFNFNFDAFLSVLEILCLVPSAVVSIGFLGWKKSSWFQFQAVSDTVNRVFLWQFVFLAGAVVVGAVIRRRQWSRVSRDSTEVNNGFKSNNLVERVEKLEEDLRSSVTIIRVLSRQLEKLGIRFRVTRKALRQPIDETAALAQKNSEATRAIAIQEDILEKEIVEIQKVLLAMQEQQQKQLELIVTIAKAGKELRDDTTPESVPLVKQEEIFVQSKSDAKNEGQIQQQQTQTNPAQTATGQKGASNDRP